jgi:penicillin-binding protein 2
MPLTAGHTEQSLRAGRARWLAAIALTGLGLCFVRLVHLQLVRGAALSRASVNNHTQVLVERAPRGRILDRNGSVLADDQPVFVALFSPIGLKPNDFPQVVGRLSGILEVQPEELERRLRAATRARAMMRVSDRLGRSQAFRILQDRIHLPGVSLTIEEQRFYPNDTLASHVIGYVGQITDEELDAYSNQGYYPGDWIGKSGLERLYDPALHGQDGGYLIEVDAHGRQVRVLRHVMPRAGKDLVLTIDRKVQEIAEQRLQETKKPGAAVVMNPSNGEVLALASSPGFNPNSFLPLGDSDERRRLLEDPKLPLYNRAIQALYPPGSVFKIVSSLAALESNAIDPAEKLYCDGSYILGKDRRVFKCWKPHGHGHVNFMTALMQSCDVYFYQLGQKTGAPAMETMAKKLGLAQITGIDLPNEKKARYLPMAFKDSKHQHWVGGDTLNYAIGQGFLQVTPMQSAALISQIAANGAYWQPYLVSKAKLFGQDDEVLNQPHMIVQNVFTASALKLVQDGLREVVSHGTGVAAQIHGFELAGKTGTAQATKGTDHAWFVSYGPVEAPKVACAVLVEHGGHGGSIAAPIAHDLMAQVLGVKEAAPAKEVESD